MENSKLPGLLLVWMAAVFAVALVRWWRKEHGCGLTIAYLLNLWLIHWLAVAIYLVPGYQNSDPQIVELGFEQSMYAVLAFAFGSVVLTPFLMNLGLFPRAVAHTPDANLPRAYIGLGIVAYLILSKVSALPSATAIVATGQQLVIIGLGLCCWQAWRQRRYRILAIWVGITLLLPFITVVTRGFISYGAAAALTVLIFTSTFLRSRFVVLIAGFLIGYLGLSVYVTYMRDRGEIREVVWGGQSLQDRTERVTTTIKAFEWLDLSNKDHLTRIDERLNQSYLVGAAVSRLSDVGDFAHGATLWEALLALIPRAVWPDKPMVAGSGTLVSEYTGIQFVAGTSVGIGQVMEFYVNFGTLGVLIGFTIMGILVTVLDLLAAECLAVGDLHGFVLRFLPGISLLQVGGSMVEIITTAVAGIFVAVLANKYLDRLQRKQALGIHTTQPELVLARHA